MQKEKTYKAAEMLGMTPLSRAELKDSLIFDRLLSPTVRAMLGRIVHVSEPMIFETIAGHFPGDEANNLNDHQLYGGQKGFVRYPYTSLCYRTEYGALVIKRDMRKIKVSAWMGEVETGKAELIFVAALRDRRFDGTKQANDSALLGFPYDHPIHHRPLHPQANSLELSIYSYAPGSRLRDAIGDPEYDQFVAEPFTFLDRPELFLKHFQQAWKSNRAPGQNSAAIKDVSKIILPGFEYLAKICGYDFLEAACSHYHVAMWLLTCGYRYNFQQDLGTMAAFAAGLKAIRDKGTPLTRSQQSWVCVLQNLPRNHIPPQFDLGGIIWPQDNIGPENLWVHKPISTKALELVPAPLATKVPAETSGK